MTGFAMGGSQPAPSPEQANATVSPTALAPFTRLLDELGPHVLERATNSAFDVLAHWGIAADDLASDPTMRVPHGVALDRCGPEAAPFSGR